VPSARDWRTTPHARSTATGCRWIAVAEPVARAPHPSHMRDQVHRARAANVSEPPSLAGSLEANPGKGEHRDRRFGPPAYANGQRFVSKNGPIHDGCMNRDLCPVTPLRQTPRSSVAITSRPVVSTDNGWSPGWPTAARRRNGAARPASALLRPCGSRQTARTRSSHATRRGPRLSTAAMERSRMVSASRRRWRAGSCRPHGFGESRVKAYPSFARIVGRRAAAPARSHSFIGWELLGNESSPVNVHERNLYLSPPTMARGIGWQSPRT
jgi:hypothetical protein